MKRTIAGVSRQVVVLTSGNLPMFILTPQRNLLGLNELHCTTISPERNPSKRSAIAKRFLGQELNH
jgi:hypothetical protein